MNYHNGGNGGCRGGCPGPQGEQGVQGPQGEPGEPGPKGEAGETPVITVAEDTPRSYKLQIKTGDQVLLTPNLFAPDSEYHADLSAVGSSLVIPLKDLVLTYQTTSTSALRITVAPVEAAVLADIRRTSVYNASTTISARTVLDEIVYTLSQETHRIVIRQQDPATKLWSLCEISSFLSAAGARCSVNVRWTEYDVTYKVPTT